MTDQQLPLFDDQNPDELWAAERRRVIQERMAELKAMFPHDTDDDGPAEDQEEP
jgi:hypothetical protein